MEIEGIIIKELNTTHPAHELKKPKEKLHDDSNTIPSANKTSDKKIVKVEPKPNNQIHQHGFRFKVLDPDVHNAGKIVIEILNKDGKVIRTIPSEEVESYMEGLKNSHLDPSSLDTYA